jgi:hypothetical protein
MTGGGAMVEAEGVGVVSEKDPAVERSGTFSLQVFKDAGGNTSSTGRLFQG